MFKGIRNIIFDLGGVIIDIDYYKTVEAFKHEGFPDFDQHFIQQYQTEFFNDYEKGLKSDADFYQYIQAIIPLSVETIDKCWNAMLLRLPLRRLQILQQLQLHYNTFLLSNTNAIHERAFNQMLKEVCGYNNWAVFFDKVYLSHRVGLRKPDQAIFELILTENGLSATETLFIDDSIQHIQAAQNLGIQTIHLTNGMTIEKDIFKPRQEI